MLGARSDVVEQVSVPCDCGIVGGGMNRKEPFAREGRARAVFLVCDELFASAAALQHSESQRCESMAKHEGKGVDLVARAVDQVDDTPRDHEGKLIIKTKVPSYALYGWTSSATSTSFCCASRSSRISLTTCQRSVLTPHTFLIFERRAPPCRNFARTSSSSSRAAREPLAERSAPQDLGARARCSCRTSAESAWRRSVGAACRVLLT